MKKRPSARYIHPEPVPLTPEQREESRKRQELFKFLLDARSPVDSLPKKKRPFARAFR